MDNLEKKNSKIDILNGLKQQLTKIINFLKKLTLIKAIILLLISGILITVMYLLWFAPENAYYRGRVGLGPKIAYYSDGEVIAQKTINNIKSSASEAGISDAIVNDAISELLRHKVITKRLGIKLTTEDLDNIAKARNNNNELVYESLDAWEKLNVETIALRNKISLAIDGDYEGKLFIFPFGEEGTENANNTKITAQVWHDQLKTKTGYDGNYLLEYLNEKENNNKFTNVPRSVAFKGITSPWSFNVPTEPEKLGKSLMLFNKIGLTKPDYIITDQTNDKDIKSAKQGYYYFYEITAVHQPTIENGVEAFENSSSNIKIKKY